MKQTANTESAAQHKIPGTNVVVVASVPQESYLRKPIWLYSHDGRDHARISRMARDEILILSKPALTPQDRTRTAREDFGIATQRIPTLIWASVVSRIAPHGPKRERLMYGAVVCNLQARTPIRVNAALAKHMQQSAI